MPGAARVAFHAALNIFGANVVAAHSALELAFAVLHLAGVALAAWAACLAVLRFFRARDLLVPALAVAIVVNLAAFVHTAQTLAATREIAAVLPLGAVLAGRLLAPRLTAARPAAAIACAISALSNSTCFCAEARFAVSRRIAACAPALRDCADCAFCTLP